MQETVRWQVLSCWLVLSEDRRWSVEQKQAIVDVETAKQTGRAAFGEMVGYLYLKAHPAVRVLLVEKADRLYRNLKELLDGGRTGCRNPLP
jgi:hypothetical protein